MNAVLPRRRPSASARSAIVHLDPGRHARASAAAGGAGPGAGAGAGAGAGSRAANGARVTPRTLAIDIGGSHIKMLVLDPLGCPITERARMKTPRPATPSAVLRVIDDLAAPLGAFERVSAGFPGVVIDGVTQTAPNLHPSWSGFPLAVELTRRIGKRARVLNDAGMQGHAVIEGRGLEMVLTLGTGLGCALFIDGRYVPNLELAHHPFRDDVTYEQYVGAHALDEIGKKKWNARIRRVLKQVQPVFNPRKIYLGGGNAKHLSLPLPANIEIIENVAGLLGGIALWRDADEIRTTENARRSRTR